MAGKKGRSGPPRNLNSVRLPWRTFWRRRALRVEHRWILPVLEHYMDALQSDKPDLSETERLTGEIAQIARGCSMLILAEAARSGLIRKIDGSWELAPGVRELARFLNVERAALLALGLERRARPVGPSLSEYLSREQFNEKSADGKECGSASVPCK